MPHTRAKREQLIRRYSLGPRKLRAALARVPHAAIDWSPGPGKWTVREVVCHCADSEMNAASRIRYVIAEKHATIIGYNQDSWAKILGYWQHPIGPALALVDAARKNTAILIRRLPKQAWKRVGHHTESGRYTAERWLELYADHLEQHARQIARNVAAWRVRRRAPGSAS
jgi:hypothetical protein